MKKFTYLVCALISLTFVSTGVPADEGDMRLGLYANIVGTYGTPSNDVLGYGIVGTYQLQDSWFLDLELIQSEGDFEGPTRFVGVQQDPNVKVIDSVFTSTLVMLHIGQNIPSESGNFNWYWSAGIGFNSLDFDNASGPVLGGGTFDIRTTADTETVIGVKAGIKQRLSDNWSMNYALRINHHFADWTVTDTVSNSTGKVDDYALSGVLIGIERKF